MESWRYIEVQRRAAAVVVRFTENSLVGLALAEMLRLELTRLISDIGGSRLIVDFSDVKSISSSIIGELLRARQRLRSQGGQIILCNVPLPIQEIYRTLNLDRAVFPVCDSVESAMRAPTVIREECAEQQMED